MTQVRIGTVKRKVSGSVSVRRTSRLSVRRRTVRRRKIMLGFILTVFFFIFVIVILRQSFMNTAHIVVTAPMGISNSSIVSIAWGSLTGSYFDIIPYSSILFFNRASVRRAILKEEPTIAAVSIKRRGLHTVGIILEPRTALSRWCGTFASSTPSNTLSQDTKNIGNDSCYLFDSSGFLYKKIASVATSSTAINNVSTSIAVGSTTPLFPYIVYAPLVATGTPYLNTITNEASLPHVFDLAQNIRIFHTAVSDIVLRGDEVDLFLNDGTRITYVRGDERNAFSLLLSVAHDISLSNGSLEYVDLRFSGKVYFRKK